MGKTVCKRVCTECGTEFIGSPRSKFCSDACKKKHDFSGTCIICGKPIYYKNKTCSKECFSILEKQINNDPKRIEENILKIKQSKLEKYGDENYNNSKQARETSLKKYGATTYIHSEEGKEVVKNIMNERYGVDYALQSDIIKEKLNNTILETGISYRFHTPEWDKMMLKKYGTTVPYKNDKIKQKGINTLLENYGVTSPAKLDWVQEKSKNTCLKKYGVEYSFQSENNKVKSKQTLFDKYGVQNALQLHKKISKINKNIGEFLGIFDTKDYEFPLDTKSFDLKFNDILIEVNPSVTHSTSYSIYNNGKFLDKNYHKNKTLLAEQNNYRCIHIWDWDDLDKVYNLVHKPTNIIYARNCDVVLIDKETADNFLELNHLQGKCVGDKIRLGLIYNDILVGLMTFGAPRYTSKYQVELLRLCFKQTYNIIGGSEKLFKYFIKNYKPTSIISYCDRSKFNGNVYNKLGFNKVSDGIPSRHWYNIKTKQHITDNLLRQRGFDQLFNTNYGKGISNEMLMKQNNFIEVYDCGQAVFEWHTDVEWN